MGISPVQLLIVLAIVVLVFGGKRLRTLGSDLGHAIKGFKEVSKDDKSTQDAVEKVNAQADERVIEGEVSKDKDHTA